MAKNISGQQTMAWRLFLQTHALTMAKLSEELEQEQGLPLAWWDVLIHLNHVPEKQLRMHDLAQSLFLTRSGVTRLLDRMEEKGLVRRERCIEDHRGAYAIITPGGISVLRRATPGHIRSVNEHFLRHLDERDIQSLCRAFSKVLQGQAKQSKVS